jgi:hypothetical protein
MREAAVAAAEAQRLTGAVALPTGWPPGGAPLPTGILPWLIRGLGWLVTALSVSLGAAFWFDVLSRALRLRSTGGRVSVATARSAAWFGWWCWLASTGRCCCLCGEVTWPALEQRSRYHRGILA